MAASASTDVRAWLREQGETPPERGPVPKALQALYDDAHGGGDEYPGEDEGVSVADPLNLAAAAPPATARGERAPRRVERSPLLAGARQRLWGPRGRPAAKPRASSARGKHARVSLAGFVSDTYADLAYLAGGLPPLQKVLYLQAPWSGQMAEATLKGTWADNMLQPAARNVGVIKALNGALGPPIFTTAIMLTGQRVQVPVMDPATGEQAIDPATGEAVWRTDFDGRTKAMFMGLKYSLMSMQQVTPAQVEQIIESAEQRRARSAAVDDLMTWIFDLTPAAGGDVESEALDRLADVMSPAEDEAPGPPAPPAAGPVPFTMDPSYPYPPAAPAMDATGADPGRSLRARGRVGLGVAAARARAPDVGAAAAVRLVGRAARGARRAARRAGRRRRGDLRLLRRVAVPDL